MFTNLFKALNFLLLLLLLCLTVYGRARANGVDLSISTLQSVKLFTTGQIQTELDTKGEAGKSNINVDSYYSSSFVATNDMMIAVVGVNRTVDSDKNVDILTKYIEMKDDGWSEKAVGTDANSNWKTQLAIQKNAGLNENTQILKGLLAVAKSNQVYLLLVNYTTPKSESPTSELTFKLVVGTVKDGETPKKIEWQETTLTVFNVSEELKTMLGYLLLGSLPFGGSASFTKEGKIVFALVVYNYEQKMTALMYSKSKETELEIVYKKIDKSCHPYYFPWEEKIVMVPFDCQETTKEKVMESTNLGTSWVESNVTLFRQNVFFKDKYGFVTVKIKTKNILLFLQSKRETNGDDHEKEFFLWISDGTHVGYVGIIDADLQETYGESVFYTNNSLFLMLSKPKNGNRNAVGEVLLVPLKKQLDNITDTLNAWDKSDETVLASCKDIKNPNNSCTSPLPTAGLIGFLHGTTDGKTNAIWKDEYYYVNATVTGNGAIKTTDGFTFSGTAVGAKWEVGKAPEDQPYNFTDPGFTLVATVEVTGDAGENSILGVGLAGANNLVGVWCTAAGKWGVSGGAAKTKVHQSAVNCTRDKKYNVALILDNTEISFYVDGEQLTGLDGEARKIERGENITHFYFGADSETLTSAKTEAKITNVLLYNRPFNTSEIDKLKVIKKEIAQTTTKDDNHKTRNLEESTIETDNSSPGTSATPTATEKDGAETKLFFMNSITVLSLLLFVGFSFMGCYV